MQARVDNYMPISDGVLGPAAGAALSWLAASLTKVSKSEFKELAARVANLEKDRVTRDEFDKRMDKLEGLVKESLAELKLDIRDIKARV